MTFASRRTIAWVVITAVALLGAQTTAGYAQLLVDPVPLISKLVKRFPQVYVPGCPDSHPFAFANYCFKKFHVRELLEVQQLQQVNMDQAVQIKQLQENTLTLSQTVDALAARINELSQKVENHPR